MGGGGGKQTPHSGQQLDLLTNTFRFLGFLVWFVVDPRGLREGSGGPRKAHGGPWRDFPGALGDPGARAKKAKNQYFLRGPFKRPKQGV